MGVNFDEKNCVLLIHPNDTKGTCESTIKTIYMQNGNEQNEETLSTIQIYEFACMCVCVWCCGRNKLSLHSIHHYRGFHVRFVSE